MIQDNPFLRKRVLVVTAHPDDEAYFAGSLRQAVESGGEVRLLCATLGERGRSYLERECEVAELQELRYQELLAASNMIGISQVYLGKYPDGGLAEHGEGLVIQISGIVEEYAPDVILGYGPDGYTGHADHIAAYIAAFSAAQASHIPYVAFALPPQPHRTELMRLLQAKRKLGVYIDSKDVLEATVQVVADSVFKLELLCHHASQLQGLNPYIVFGEELGGHLMKHEYFHILS